MSLKTSLMRFVRHADSSLLSRSSKWCQFLLYTKSHWCDDIIKLFLTVDSGLADLIVTTRKHGCEGGDLSTLVIQYLRMVEKP